MAWGWRSQSRGGLGGGQSAAGGQARLPAPQPAQTGQQDRYILALEEQMRDLKARAARDIEILHRDYRESSTRTMGCFTDKNNELIRANQRLKLELKRQEETCEKLKRENQRLRILSALMKQNTIDVRALSPADPAEGEGEEQENIPPLTLTSSSSAKSRRASTYLPGDGSKKRKHEAVSGLEDIGEGAHEHEHDAGYNADAERAPAEPEPESAVKGMPLFLSSKRGRTAQDDAGPEVTSVAEAVEESSNDGASPSDAGSASALLGEAVSDTGEGMDRNSERTEGASDAASGEAAEGGVGEGGCGGEGWAGARPKRRTSSISSYEEPRLNSKLRQGDKNTFSLGYYTGIKTKTVAEQLAEKNRRKSLAKHEAPKDSGSDSADST